MRIRQKYTLTLICLALIPLLAGMIYVLIEGRKQTTELSLESVQNKMANAAQSLGSFFNARKSEIAVYAEMPLLQSMDFQEIRPFLMRELDRHEGIYEKFILGTPEGHFYNTAGGNPHKKMLRTFNDKSPDAKPKSISKRDYWQATTGKNINNEKVTIVSNPMISYTTGAKQIVIASTIRANGKTTGMLGGALPWQNMETYLRSLFDETFKNSKLKDNTFLISHSGVYWYHWDNSKVVHLLKDPDGKPVLNEQGQKISVTTNIADDPSPEFATIGHRIAAGERGVEAYYDSIQQETNYVVFTPIPNADYSIGIVVPESEILQAVNKLEDVFVATILVVTLVALAVSLILSGGISRPILQLNTAVREINKGKLKVMNLKITNDEIGELTQSYNEMIKGLRKHQASVIRREREILRLNRNLSLRIKDRTQDLEKANIQLTKKVNDFEIAQKQLAKNKVLLQNTGKLARVGGWELCLETDELSCTDEIFHILGIDQNTKLHLANIIGLCAPVYQQELKKAISQVSEDAKSFELDVILYAKNKKEIWARIIGVPHLNNGKVENIFGALQDITQLKTVDKLKNEFVSTVSHELRTPITSINGSIGLIKNGIAGQMNKEMSSLMEIIDRNSNRLLYLINDILDIEKIESGKLEYHFEDANIDCVVENAIEANQQYAIKFNCSISLTNKIESVPVFIDTQRVIQVLANLLSNASKFSSEGSEIKVIIDKVDDNYVRVSVVDCGPGISKEFENKVFQKFSQEDSSTVRKHTGTGLGLSICKALIENMGGKIGFITSDNGCTFYFDLPILQPKSKTITND